MRSGIKRGFILQEILYYIIIIALALGIALRSFTGVLKTYLDARLQLKAMDYAYMAFERIKEDLHSNTDSLAISGGVLYILKDESVNGRYIKMFQSADKLRYAVGSTTYVDTPVQNICVGLRSSSFRIENGILIIRLIFDGLELERGFQIEY
jgi:hypothetical protein